MSCTVVFATVEYVFAYNGKGYKIVFHSDDGIVFYPDVQVFIRSTFEQYEPSEYHSLGLDWSEFDTKKPTLRIAMWLLSYYLKNHKN